MTNVEHEKMAIENANLISENIQKNNDDKNKEIQNGNDENIFTAPIIPVHISHLPLSSFLTSNDLIGLKNLFLETYDESSLACFDTPYDVKNMEKLLLWVKTIISIDHFNTLVNLIKNSQNSKTEQFITQLTNNLSCQNIKRVPQRIFRKNKFSIIEFLDESDTDVLIHRFQRSGERQNLNIISEKKSSTSFGEALMFLKQFILDETDWHLFTEILFEKMKEKNHVFYLNATKQLS